jgi:hypothetical protein
MGPEERREEMSRIDNERRDTVMLMKTFASRPANSMGDSAEGEA